MTVTTTYSWTSQLPNDFVNNVVTTGAQAKPAVTRVGSGFVATWNDGQTNGNVEGRIYTDFATPLASEFTVNSVQTGLQASSSVTTLSDGRIAVTWIDNSVNANGLVRVRVFSATGAPAAGDFTVGTGSSQTVSQPHIAGLANGNLVVSYTRDYGSNDLDTNFTIYTPSGTVVNSLSGLNSSTAVLSNQSSVAALQGSGATANGFVAVWVDQALSSGAPTGNQSVYFQRFGPTGSALDASPVLIDSFGTLNNDIQVISLKDGGFAVAYADNGWNISGTEITLRVYNADGSDRSNYVRVNQTVTNGDQYLPSLTQMDNGFIVVGWSDASPNSYLKAFTPAGIPADGSELVNYPGSVIESEVVALSGGSVEVVRSSTVSDSAGDASIRASHADLSRTSVGDANPNTFVGDVLIDNMTGGAAADTFTGAGGNDNIDGGGGVDTAVFSGTRASYSIVRAGVGTIKVVDVRSGSPDGTDTLVNVERLQFSDYSKTALQPLGSDYDGQGRGDLLFRNSNGGGIVDWDGANSSTAYGLGGVGTEWSIVTGDLDGDGRTDIIFRNTGSGQNVVWNGGLSSTAHALTAVDPVWKLLFTGDFDGDGKADLFFRNDSSGAMVIWKGGDSGNSAYLGGVGPEWQIKAGDFDGDGKTDLIFRNLNSGGNVVWDGGISSTAHALTAVDTVWSLAAVGDFDGDGKADLAFLNTSTGAVVTWSAGNSASAVFRGTTVTNAQVLAGDFNGDGYSDLFLRNPSTGALVVWDGAASSTAHTIGGVGSEWQIFG